ncbi:MAG: hypothetical protein ACPGEG_09620 [Salibacteraceae bacterium]
MKQKTVLFILFVLMSAGLSAQSPQQWKKHGDASLKDGDVTGAINYYKKAVNGDSTNLAIWMSYANALKLNNNYSEAALVFQRVYEDPYQTEYDEALYWWAKMFQNVGKYENAAHNFKNFENYHSTRGSFLQKDAQQQYKACVWALKHSGDTLINDVQNLGVQLNSNYTEMGATLINDSTLIYSGLRYIENDSTLEISENETNKTVRLYEAKWRNNSWVEVGELDSIINAKGMHIGNANFYTDWNWLVYSSCKTYNDCQIMYSELKNEKWQEPEALSESINLPNFNSTQPYLTNYKNKPTLFFTSNRPQGQGGLDIWYSVYNKRLKGFAFPRNMGRKINTPGNEITPFVQEDSSVLYFSSDYHLGFGGFDIFSSKLASLRSGQSPSNVGLNANSSANDIYYKTYPNDSMTFLTSNRNGGISGSEETCCNDMYYFKTIPPQVVDTVIDTTELIPVVTNVEELNEYLPVLYFHNDQPNPRSTKTITKKTYLECFEEYREMKVHYLKEYTHQKSGLEKDSAVYRINNFFTDKIEKGIEEFDLFMDLLFGQLAKGESVVITIKGYASPLAKSDYNINLTHRRIQSLINYLEEYKNGELKPYLDGTANNGAKIEFIKIPYGDSQAAQKTSDDLSNKINAVYSPSAMEERRIEILHISQKEK